MVCLFFVTGCETLEHRLQVAANSPQTGVVTLPPGVSLSDPLTEDQAVWIALLNNAAFQEAMADVGLAEADILQARTLPNPTLSMLFPAGPKQLEFAVKYPVEAIWLRPKRVEIAKLDAEKIAKTLQQSSLDLIRDTRIAFTNVRLAKERVILAREALELSGKITALVDARRRAGTALAFEATMAGSDELQAKHALAELKDDVKIASGRLAKLLGAGSREIFVAASGASSDPQFPPDSTTLMDDAFAARPDLRAAEIAIESAMKRAGLAEIEAYQLTVVLDSNNSGSDFEAGPGIDLPIPIFDRNQGGRARAKTMIKKTSKHYLAVRHQIILEVRESHTRALQAQRSAETWKRDIIPPLESTITKAEKAYKGGTTSFLQVVESNRKLTAARLRHTEARADLHRAIAELERAVGHHQRK